MIKPLFGTFAVALVISAFSSALVAQDADRGANDGPPRLTPEERREQWEQMRHLSPEQRRARLQELRENRSGGGETPAAPIEETSPEPPENYLEQLELRSIVTLDGVTEFSLRNPYESRTFVVSAGQSRNGIEVVEFDAEQSALTLRHEGETRVLFLKGGQVAALDESQQPEGNKPERNQRREAWEDRRERFRQFRETWQEAAENSPELREIEGQFRDLAGDFRENRAALRDAEPGTAEHEKLRAQEQEMREEFRLLTEYSVLEMKKNPAFDPDEVESLQGMMRGMMFRGARGEGYRGHGSRSD